MRKEQTRIQALGETVTSRFVGFVVALITAELFVYEMFGLSVSATQNIGIMVYWTCQSVVVGYMMRRFFEYRGR